MRFVITASIGEPGENMKMLCAFVLVIASATAEAAEISAGSGVMIGTQGEILTNSHVVEDCQKITVQFSSKYSETAVLVARDQRNDLAVVRTSKPLVSIAAFRDGAPVRAGDAVVALGYPLSGLLASTANVSVGNVSALAGLGDNSRYLQISAPVQPGNSGGPLLDASGHLVGIVTAKLNAVRVAKFTGDIPQNVNFALKAEVARTFLDSKGIAYRKAPSDQQLSPADVGDIARPFTVHIECQQAASRVAAAPTTSDLPPNVRVSIREIPPGFWSRVRRANPPPSPTAGGLRIEGRVGDGRIPHGQISFELYKGSQFVTAIMPGDVTPLPEGTYHIVSNYGDANSTVRSDIRVQADRFTDVTVNHRAAIIMLKLVNERGGEARANTQWSVLAPGGDVIKVLIGAFPRVILAEGEYRVIARNDNKTYEGAFRVVSGVDGEVEVITHGR